MKKKASRRLLDYKQNCYEFKEDIQPGDYAFNFEFQLPHDLPASIYYLNKDHNQKPKAKVRYSIKASILTEDKRAIAYKQMLIVHEPPNAKKGILEADDEDQFHLFDNTKQLSTCGCFNKGKSSLKVRFNKNVLVQNEKAIADVEVDNSESMLKVSEVEFEIIQSMYIKCHDDDEEEGEEFRWNFPIICNIDKPQNLFAGRKAPHKN